MPLLLRSRRAPVLVALLLAGSVLVGCGDDGSDAPAGLANPYAGTFGYADPHSHTAQAAAAATDERSKEVFHRLALAPQGVWITPEEHPAGDVTTYVNGVLTGAGDAGQVVTLVVYGIPDRDCSGGFSAGGLSEADYGPWVQRIADAIDGRHRVVVVVEPDALAAAVDCGDVGTRTGLIRDAAERLEAAGATVYLDGGHSNWRTAKQMATLLRDAGVSQARGFATNVSNFQTDEDETSYGDRISDLLDGAHFIIDTGRNGFGASDEWCNPPGRAFGTPPSGTTDGGALDAYVWVKPPGESDGQCNGGPAAGEFWPERALDLASASGW